MKVGNIIKDNDPRVGTRRLRIESFEGETHVRAGRIDNYGRRMSYPRKGFRVRIDRIHTDGKPRRSGFSLANAENSHRDENS